MSVENSFGSSNAVVLSQILDPREEKKGLLETLAVVPDNVLEHILFLCTGYNEEQIEFIAEIATSSPPLSCQLGAGPDNGGIIHHAAIIAPVVTTFGHDYPSKWVSRAVDTMRDQLSKYWKCGPSDYELTSRNRFLFARGAAMQYFATEGASVPSWKNDALFIWTGSKYDDLWESASDIMDDGTGSKDYLESISMEWIPEEAVLENGMLDPKFEEENMDRLDGCSGPPSILTESEWEIVTEHSLESEFRLGDISIERYYLACLTHFTGEVTEDIPFIKTLMFLADGMEDVAVGEIALIMQDFDISTLKMIERACANYTVEQREAVLNVLADEGDTPDPNDLSVIEDVVRFTAAISPLLEEYVCFDELTTDDVEDVVRVVGEDEAQSMIMTDNNDQFLGWVSETYSWYHTAVALEEYEVTDENFIDVARGLAACHLVSANNIEDASIETIITLGKNMNKIVFHSDDLMTTRNLNLKYLDSLI